MNKINCEPMLSQPPQRAPMLSQAHGGASQRSLFGGLQNMRAFYGVCDWCDAHWWDNPIERWAWRIDDCTDVCPVCGEVLDWYDKVEVEREKKMRGGEQCE